MDKKVLVIKPVYESIPVSFAYVLASLKEHGIPFDFIDATLHGTDITQQLAQGDYFAVATGGLSWYYGFFMDIVRQTRQTRPELPIILGGNVTKDIRPDFLFDKIGVDYGVLGEAEVSFPGLLMRLREGRRDVADLPGLIYRDQETRQIIRKPPARLDLTAKNIIPAWDYFDLNLYSKDMSLPFWGVRSAMPILSGRGCVGHCAFCSPTIGVFRKRPIAHVIEEIEHLNARYKFDWIVFWNEMFYDTKADIVEFCEAYRKVVPRKPWVCSLRVDVKGLDRETLKIMKEAGCVSISAGIESGSNKVLKHMCKNITKDMIIDFYRMAKEVKLPCFGTFIAAHAGEAEEDLKETIDMVIAEEMNTDACITSAYPGTLIYRNALKRGLIKDEWAFLAENVDGWTSAWIGRQQDYLNISDIPDDKFWQVIVREHRRFFSFRAQRYCPRDIRIEKVWGIFPVGAKGTCVECGAEVHMAFSYQRPYPSLSVEAYCPKCFMPATFDFFRLEAMSSHYKFLQSCFKAATKVVVVGTNVEAFTFLRVDVLGIDYTKIAAFLEQGAYTGPFVDTPRCRWEDLPALAPDLVLVIDEGVGDAEIRLRLQYLQAGGHPPRVVHLWPYGAGMPSALLAGMDFLRIPSGPKAFYRLALRAVVVPVRLAGGWRLVMRELGDILIQVRASGMKNTFVRKMNRYKKKFAPLFKKWLHPS